MRLGDYCLLGVLALGLAMGSILALRELVGCCRSRAAKKRSGKTSYKGEANRRSETQEKSGTYTPCTHPTLSACSMCTTMEEVVVDEVSVDEVEKASVKGPDDEKIETEKETPLEIVVVKESEKDKLVVGKVEKSVVEEEVPMDEVEKASVKGPEPLEVVTVEESYKDKVVVALQLTPGTLIGGWIEGRVEESVVEEEVSEEKVEKAFMRGPDEGKAETEDETPFEPQLNSTQIEVVMMEESDKDEVIAGKVEESVVEEEGGEDTSAQRKFYIKNKNQQDKVVVAEGAVVDKVFDKKEDWAEMIEPENIEKVGLVSGVLMAEDVTQKESVDEVTVEGAEGRRKLKRAEVNTEYVEVMKKMVAKLDKAVVQGALESYTKQEVDYEDETLEVQVSEDEGDGYWWDADEDLKKLEEEDEVDISFGIVTKEDVEKKLQQLAIKNGSLEQQLGTETEESEAAKEQSCWRSS